MKNTEFKVEDVFGNVANKIDISTEQKNKLNNFSQEDVNVVSTKQLNMLSFKFCIKLKLLETGRKKTHIEPISPPSHE